jgi:hypothetical protein
VSMAGRKKPSPESAFTREALRERFGDVFGR